MSSVCVHGLGYVGLPTAAMLANHGHEVAGYDTNSDVTTALQSGDVHLEEPGLRAFVTQALESGQLKIVDAVPAAEYHVICVPTPFDETTQNADLTAIHQSGRAINKSLREGDTVILESTVPPGTTTTELRPILEASGLSAGSDFGLAFCPETVLPGDIITELQHNNRIVGGINGMSIGSAVRLYETFVDGTIETTTSPTTAEFVKLIQNTFRDTNIALANEIAKLARAYDIDSREAISLANEHPRVDILQPGPGVGGHCLPIDPWFLGAEADELDLIARARRINDGMIEYVIDLLEDELGTLDGKKVTVLGVAYKGNVGDTRMSPGLDLARRLQGSTSATASGPPDDDAVSTEVAIHDPHVTDETLALEPLDAATAQSDAIVVMADHDEFERLEVSSLPASTQDAVLVDTKAVLDKRAWERTDSTVVTI